MLATFQNNNNPVICQLNGGVKIHTKKTSQILCPSECWQFSTVNHLYCWCRKWPGLVIPVICYLQWLHVFFFSAVAQELRASSDGLWQALTQIPVFPGKALLLDTECSSGTVCTLLSHYQCMWTLSSLLSTVQCTKTNLYEEILCILIMYFHQGNQRKCFILTEWKYFLLSVTFYHEQFKLSCLLILSRSITLWCLRASSSTDQVTFYYSVLLLFFFPVIIRIEVWATSKMTGCTCD